MNNKYIRAIKYNLSYNKYVILKSQNLATLRLRLNIDTIEACNEADFEKNEGDTYWWEIKIKDIKKYDDFDII